MVSQVGFILDYQHVTYVRHSVLAEHHTIAQRDLKSIALYILMQTIQTHTISKDNCGVV